MSDQSEPIIQPTARLKKTVRLMVGILVVLFLLCLLVYLNHNIAGYGGRWEVTDFMEIYLGGRALLEGVDLYNPTAWGNLHQKYAEYYNGNPIFIYPLPAVFLFWPFALFSINSGATIWLLVNEVLMIILIGYMIRHNRMRNSTAALLALALIIGIYLPTILVIGSGQYSAMMLILILGVYLLLEAGVDWAAGVCFALLFNRPNPILLVFPVVVIWALVNRRYKFIWSTLICGFVFLVVSVWISPRWISTWLFYTLGGVGKINSYGLISQTLRGMFVELSSGLSSSTQFVLILIISLLTILLAALVVIRKKDYSLITLLAVAVTTSLCISPYAWNYDQMILLFPMIYILMRSENGSTAQGLLAWMGVILIYLLLPYVIRYEEMLHYKFTYTAIMPFTVLGLLLWVILAIPGIPKQLQLETIGLNTQ